MSKITTFKEAIVHGVYKNDKQVGRITEKIHFFTDETMFYVVELFNENGEVIYTYSYKLWETALAFFENSN